MAQSLATGFLVREVGSMSGRELCVALRSEEPRTSVVPLQEQGRGEGEDPRKKRRPTRPWPLFHVNPFFSTPRIRHTVKCQPTRWDWIGTSPRPASVDLALPEVRSLRSPALCTSQSTCPNSNVKKCSSFNLFSLSRRELFAWPSNAEARAWIRRRGL